MTVRLNSESFGAFCFLVCVMDRTDYHRLSFVALCKLKPVSTSSKLLPRSLSCLQSFSTATILGLDSHHHAVSVCMSCYVCAYCFLTGNETRVTDFNVSCRDGFYYDESSLLCKPKCGEWSPLSPGVYIYYTANLILLLLGSGI